MEQRAHPKPPSEAEKLRRLQQTTIFTSSSSSSSTSSSSDNSSDAASWNVLQLLLGIVGIALSPLRLLWEVVDLAAAGVVYSCAALAQQLGYAHIADSLHRYEAEGLADIVPQLDYRLVCSVYLTIVSVH
jgi:BRCT domain type II-containing protein